jgi:uncharacterized protein YcnI
MNLSKRAGLLAASVLSIVLVTPAVASAHVSVNPREANQGGFTVLTFRVPNERDDSGTNKVQVTFPENAVIPFVSVQPVPGWEYEVARRTLDEPVDAEGTEITEVVESITWTGGPVNPGEFQEFPVSVGPLPSDVDSLTFPAVQTYESGEEVRWIEEATEGGEEPEHPVPTLTLLPAAEDEHGGGSDATEEDDDANAEEDDDAAAAADSGAEDDDEGTDGIAIAALVIAILAVLLAGAGLIIGRPKSSSN